MGQRLLTLTGDVARGAEDDERGLTRPDRDDRVDVVSDSAGPSLEGGGVVVVVDVRVSTKRVRMVVAHRSRTVSDPALERGVRKVVHTGRDGWVLRTVRTVRHDGEVISRRTVKMQRQVPLDRVVAIGTRTPTLVGGGAVSLPSGSPNWAALAACESSGNPAAVSRDGLYHGLFQFDQRTWESVGGSGSPSQATPAEQVKRAKILYSQRGAQPWPVCGKRL